MQRPPLDRAVLVRAVRAAVVIPAVFAVGKAWAPGDAGTFAAFGGFALLVFVEYTGSFRTRLVAYLGLGAAGTGLVVLGTLCSARLGTAVVGMAVVGFGVLFAGLVNGYFAAGSTSALLAFVLPVTLPPDTGGLSDRLIGWGLACAGCIPAALFLWPPRGKSELRAAAAAACRALSEQLAATGSDPAAGQRSAAAMVRLARRAVATSYRSTGPTARDLALANLVEEIRWLHPFVDRLTVELPRLEPGRADRYRAVAAAGAAVLRTSAERLAGGAGPVRVTELAAAREDMMRALVARAAELLDDGSASELAVAFQLRGMSHLVGLVAGHADRAAGGHQPVEDAPLAAVIAVPLRATAATLRVTRGVAADLASPRTVWFRNSVRGGAGLALAVLAARVGDLQHAFWVVLGSLSVLRSSAVGTGTTAARAVAGTVAGLVGGGALLLLIGTDERLLWAAFPISVFLAAYGPAVSFVATQAAFTVTVVVLFNLIQPVGWRVGLVRVEDVVVGAAVSVVVGLLMWPRGAARVLWQSLAVAYSAGAELVLAAGRRLVDGHRGPTETEVAAADEAVRTAARRLDDALRQYVAEDGNHPVDVSTATRAAAAVGRLRFTARSLDGIRQVAAGVGTDPCGALVAADLDQVHRWYADTALALVHQGPVPPADPAPAGRAERLRACVAGAAAAPDEQTVRSGLLLVWASEYVEELRRIEEQLAVAATEISGTSAQRWWR